MKNIEVYIPGFEGRYVVSNHGYVRKVGKKKKNYGTLHNRGYLICHITDNSGKSRMFLMSRLVAQAFIPNPEGKPQVDHIDTDRMNNRADNLRWVWPRENAQNFRTVANSRQLKIFSRNKGRKPCIVVYPDSTRRYFNTFSEAAASLGCSVNSIHRCYYGDQKDIFNQFSILPWKEPTLFESL